MKKYGFLFLKIFLWIIGAFLFLVLAVFCLIRVPAVQDFARKKTVSYLQGKIKTKVEIGRISLNLPKLLVLENVYFEDQQRDTLLAGDTLKVDISLFKLLNDKLELNEIDLRGITVNIERRSDSSFNYDYIVKAFAGKQQKTAKPEDTASTMQFSIDKINLDRVQTRFKDAISSNDAAVYIGHFDTRVKLFDPEKMKFSLTGINSDKIHIDYSNEYSAIQSTLRLGSLDLENAGIDLINQRIDLDGLDLENSAIVVRLDQLKAVPGRKEPENDTLANSWRIFSNSVKLTANNIRFDNFNLPVQKNGMDFGHLDIKDLNLGIKDLKYAPDSISGKLNNASFRDKSGFNLQELKTEFFYGKTQAYLDKLYAKTSHSLIQNQIRLEYPSIESLAKKPGELKVNALLNESRLGFRDILIVMPAMATIDPFKTYPDATIKINGKVNGKVKDLRIPELEISGFRNTSLRASGRITGLPDLNKAYLDLKIDDFSSRSADLMAFIPHGTIPATIRLPDAVKLQGTFKGGIASFNTNLGLNSSFGSAKTIASYDARLKGKEKYKATIRLFNFNVGRLMRQDTIIGRVTLAANVSGTGIDPKTLSANFAANVVKAEYNGYAYRNLHLKGNSQNGNLATTANIKDPNLVFSTDLKANLGGKYPKLKLVLNLDSANLQKLNFVKDNIRFHGKLEADLPTADLDYLNGRISLTETVIASGGTRYQLDSVNIISTATVDSNTLKLNSEVLSAHVSGKYKLSEVTYAMQDLLNRYFLMGTKPKTLAYAPQMMAFDARLINGPLLSQIVPELKELATVTLNGHFNSEKGELALNASAPRILYGTNDLSNLQLLINTENNALNYSLNVARIGTPQLQLLNTSITGKAQNNILSADLQVKDLDKKLHYRIAGNLQSSAPDFRFSLLPEGLILNYQPWAAGADNEIRFGSSGIQASNFVLSNTNQRLSINSIPPGLNNPLQIDFSNFKMETLTSIVKKDSLLLGGTINGNAVLSNLQSSPVFVADIKINDFNFRGDTLGLVSVKVNNRQPNVFATTASITGEGNQLNLEGNYNTGNSSFNMDLNIANLNLKSIEGFTFGAITRSSGSINGKLAIKGTAEAPQIRGGLNFNEAAFNISMLNSYFKVKNNQLVFNDDGILFNNFALADSAGNTASVDGTIFTKTYTDFRFALRVNSDNFRVINSTSKDNDLYYGQLYLNTRLRIGGTMNSPSVDGTLKVNDKTKFTIVLPQTDPALAEREGIVEFVDMDNPDLAAVLSSAIDSLNTSPITGMDVSLNVELDKNAEFSIVVDEANGDFLRVKGEAQLNAGIDPSGKVTLTGIYQLEEGEYELSFNFLKRRFEIEQGSTITWTGEPTTAALDVTAVYVANTAPLDLVENTLGDAPQAMRNTYKQKLPFEVNLSMKGELLKPDITFDIILPEKNYNVSTEITSVVNDKLTQLRQEPSELNKQVFALLLLNRFVGENPFSSSAGGGGGATTLARQSVSKLLSEQINNLAGDLLGGVELNFDLQASEDYTTGQLANRTDLNVGLSKRLLNDRLKVNIGSNFELEGPSQPGAKTSNLAGDVSVEYQLSKDGRYLLRAYQKNEYQVALQGQVIETGVGFVLTMDYNKFKEIFQRRTEDAKKRRRELRAAKKLEKE